MPVITILKELSDIFDSEGDFVFLF